MSQAVKQPKHTYPQNFETTTHKILRTALGLVREFLRKDKKSPAVEEGMEILDELFSVYSMEHPDRYKSLTEPLVPVGDDGLGFARYAAKSDDGPVYRILAKKGNQTKVRGIWYPATTYQNSETGQIYTCITEEFEAKFREFDSYQDAFTWGGDF